MKVSLMCDDVTIANPLPSLHTRHFPDQNNYDQLRHGQAHFCRAIVKCYINRQFSLLSTVNGNQTKFHMLKK